MNAEVRAKTCSFPSFLVSFIGVAAIIGAFLAGITLAEAVEDNEDMHKQTNGVMEFLAPFFLVNIGMQLDLSVFRAPSVIILAVVVTFVAVATKLIGCGVGAWALSPRRAA